jgi:cell division protein FtsL
MKLAALFEQLNVDMQVFFLLVAVIVSSMAVIYTKHISRSEFIALQKLEKQRDQLNEEWGKLLLEQSTWANPGRVEQQARLRLNMLVPTADMTVVIDND